MKLYSLYSLCVCLLDCEFPARVHRARRGTVGSWGPPAADSRTRPCKRRTPSPSILFYLEAEKQRVNNVRCTFHAFSKQRTRYALDCLNVLFFPPLFLSFFPLFLQTRSPRFVRWTLFVLGEQQWIEEGKEKGRGGWVKFAFWNWLAVVWNIIMNGIFEKMLVQCVPHAS